MTFGVKKVTYIKLEIRPKTEHGRSRNLPPEFPINESHLSDRRKALESFFISVMLLA